MMSFRSSSAPVLLFIWLFGFAGSVAAWTQDAADLPKGPMREVWIEETGAAADLKTPQAMWTRPVPGVRRGFWIEKRKFLLGEPIVIEYRVEVDVPGTWEEPMGCNYRSVGRDDNFGFALQAEDGTWSTDVFPPLSFYSGGGLGNPSSVTHDKPLSVWFPLQLFVAIRNPGQYELYCFKCRAPVDGEYFVPPETVGSAGNPGAGPTLTRKLEAVPELPSTISTTSCRKANLDQALAHFSIVIEQGSPEEQSAMVERVLAETRKPDEGFSTRIQSLREAACFVLQDDFLPMLEQLKEGFSRRWNGGLSVHPNPRAWALYWQSKGNISDGDHHFSSRTDHREVIPGLIELLTHESVKVRVHAAYYLQEWTDDGVSFPWEGKLPDRPTPEEAIQLQKSWREWWEKNGPSYQAPPMIMGQKLPKEFRRKDLLSAGDVREATETK